MTLVGEPGRHRDLRQRQVADAHQLLGGLYTLMQQPLVRRQADGDSERPREMTDREIELGCDLLQRELAAEVRLEPLAGALRLPGRETAARGRGRALEPAIGLRDMGGQAEHHMVNEELVGLIRLAQPFLERGADVADDSIVMADADLTVE